MQKSLGCALYVRSALSVGKYGIICNLETTRLRCRPRNRWEDELREDGRLVGAKRVEGKWYVTERNGRSSW
jgi:hypothetical protein